MKLRKDLGHWVNVEEIEIIGNIFDNPELLEEEGIMSNNKCCGTCKYHHHENIDDGFVCANVDSEYVAEWTEYDDWCEEWEGRD